MRSLKGRARDQLLRANQTLASKVGTLEEALLDARRQLSDAARSVQHWKAATEVLSTKVDLYHDALADIASRPTEERNPDGVDQAAYSMQLIAREALGLPL